MAAGPGRGGASSAGFNHPALAFASAAPPYSRRGLFVVHLYRHVITSWESTESLRVQASIGPGFLTSGQLPADRHDWWSVTQK